MWPQIILIILFAIGFGRSATKHGQKEYDEENAWMTLISIAILTSILAWGGFWSPLFK